MSRRFSSLDSIRLAPQLNLFRFPPIPFPQTPLRRSGESCLIQPVDARRSRSRAIQHFYTQYSEGKSRQERYTQRCNFEIDVAEARAEDLKDRNLGYIPK